MDSSDLRTTEPVSNGPHEPSHEFDTRDTFFFFSVCLYYIKKYTFTVEKEKLQEMMGMKIAYNPTLARRQFSRETEPEGR